MLRGDVNPASVCNDGDSKETTYTSREEYVDNDKSSWSLPPRPHISYAMVDADGSYPPAKEQFESLLLYYQFQTFVFQVNEFQ